MKNGTRYAKCRSCGSNIIWVRMTSGKNMPCDWKPIHYKPACPDEEGQIVTLITPGGKVVHGIPEWTSDNFGYTSHFATCPNAEEHRRRTEKEDEQISFLY